MGDPARYGLDAAAAAAFLALVWPRVTGPGSRLAQTVAAGAVVVALALTPLVPAGIPVLLAAVVAIVAGLARARPGAGRMSAVATWVALVAAAAVVFALKLAGHLVPKHWLAEPRVARTAALVTVALLSALVAVQTATRGNELVLDARLPALVVAAIALALRAPFIVVVLLAAVTAAVLRALGMP